MSKVCSVCLLLSPHDLNPLFAFNGKTWEDTGLSKMLEFNNKSKIIRDNQSKLFICNYCVQKTMETYFKIDQEGNTDNSAFDETKQLSTTPQSCEVEDNANPRKKIKLFHLDDGILRFAEPIKKDLINSLDYDCLARIFSYLEPPQIVQMEEVCTKWRDASSLTWYDIKEFNEMDNNNDLETQKDVERILLRCGNYLTTLWLDELCESSIMSVVKENCPNLMTLDLPLKYTRIEDFNEVFSGMKKLKKIYIGIYSCPENEGECPATVDHAQMLHSLPEGVEQIHLSGPYENDDNPPIMNNLSLALEKFHTLSNLKISSYKIDDCAILSELKTLVSLNFEDCDFTPNALLTSNLPNLEKLNLRWTNYIDEFLTSVANQCMNLKHLSMEASRSRSKLVLRTLGNFTNLEYLNLSGVENVDALVIISITKGCKKLKTLNLEQCKNASPLSLQLLKNLKCLEHLNLGQTNINGNVIRGITEKCQQLKFLKLNCCTNISSITLEKLGNLKNLENLELLCTRNVADSVIKSLAKNCNKLKSLSIVSANYQTVSDSSLKELIINCRFLKQLIISHTNISLDTLIFAAHRKNHCHNNVVLTITIWNKEIIKSFNNLKIISPFLKIQ